MKEKDMELLTRLYEIHSESNKESDMRAFVVQMCERYGAKTQIDKVGNVFVTKGKDKTYPCVCAHLDQVQHNHASDFHVIRVGDVLMGFSESERKQQGLGADDKNGIWIALMLLRELDALKCAFFVGEEIGCVGSSSCDLTFFKDCRFLLQADRKNAGDLITNIGGKIANKRFVKATGYNDFGYKPTEGLTTDVGTLSHRGVGLCCVNISCGYYNAHTDTEVTIVSELENALAFALHICMTCVDVYKHKYVQPKPKLTNFSWRAFKDYSFDDWWKYDDKRAIRQYITHAIDPTFDDMIKNNRFHTKDKVSLYFMYEEMMNDVLNGSAI